MTFLAESSEIISRGNIIMFSTRKCVMSWHLKEGTDFDDVEKFNISLFLVIIRVMLALTTLTLTYPIHKDVQAA